MVPNGSRDDRGKSCIILRKEVAEGRIHKSGAMRCKSSDRPIVAVTLCESTEKVSRGWKPEHRARSQKRRACEGVWDLAEFGAEHRKSDVEDNAGG